MSNDGENPLQDRLVTPERSVFGTRLPRPTGVGRHLVIVIVVSAVALAIAIGFAERDVSAPKASAPESTTT
jgi:hypothetical protein